jgi:hypothetical protein
MKRLYASRNKQRRADVNAASHIKRKYGITLAAYDAVLASQNGGCAICGSTKAGRPMGRRLLIDHNHTTQEIRGLLCHRCNAAIGLFGDDADLVAKAAAYLRKPSLQINSLIQLPLFD